MGINKHDWFNSIFLGKKTSHNHINALLASTLRYHKITIDRPEQQAKPINNGRVDVTTKRPIKVLIGTAIIVEIKPVIAAAIPAIWPTGSMARALMFPKRKPIKKNCKPNEPRR